MTRLIARKPLLWMCVLALLVAASATWAAGRASAAGGHAALTPAKVGTAKAHQPARHDSRALTINWALPGTATAGASQDANPPGNAIDGNAATSWCTNSWPDTLTVDLGQIRDLNGIGVTLDNASSYANAQISLATTPGDWHVVPTAKNVALDPGNPMYLPLSQNRGQPGHLQARFAQIEVWDSGATPVCLGEFRLFGVDTGTANMMLGSDLSFTPQEVAAGAVFTDHGVAANPAKITADNGANWARIRLWVNPPAGYSDLADDLAFARTLQADGLKIYLDLHYSDFWADPGKQCIPAGWPTDLAGLTAKVQSYTQQVISAFASQGTPVDMVSIGNEVTNGMLWAPSTAPPGVNFGCSGPGVGGLDWTTNTTATGWSNFTALLKAGVAGAQAGNPARHKLLVAIHTDLGGNNARAQVFYSNLETAGVPFDVIALSYYPIFQGPLSALHANLGDLAGQFGKPLIIAENQYSWTLANGDALGNSTWQTSQLIDGYPASPGGQLSIVNDELSMLASLPHGLGAGLFYWAPEWLPGVSWAPDASPPGTPDDNETLFDFTGHALPSIGMFRDPVEICTQSNPSVMPCVIGS
ncbi:MAG TPA: glycosyl hydrolase 53 family protein [Streptosporangiaceae bacterium]|nr:glycosyl hydrolase 53 family protein [Streptosporangiaceae bacterium]